MAAYAREASLSEEEAGRQIRYSFFGKVLATEGEKHQTAEEKWKIAVAHNRNDRAETMLFHLFRGTGLAGLCGIPAVNGRIIRPLLCLDRQEIEDYLKKERIHYYTDSTNQEDHYARNRIRHHILPYAEAEICRNAVAHMNQTAENLRLSELYLEKQTEEAAERCVLSAGNVAAECCWQREADPSGSGCFRKRRSISERPYPASACGEAGWSEKRHYGGTSGEHGTAFSFRKKR